MPDIFEFWEQGKSIAENKYLQSIRYESGRLVIALKGLNEDNPVLTITFKDHFSFKSTNESFRLNSLYQNKFQNGINYTHDSSYLQWIKEETHGIYNDLNLTHYLICSNDDITDVISASAPILNWEQSV